MLGRKLSIRSIILNTLITCSLLQMQLYLSPDSRFSPDYTPHIQRILHTKLVKQKD